MVTIPTSQEPITYTSRDLVNTTWYKFFSEVGRISPFMQTVLDDSSQFTALQTLGITIGSYTPVLTNTTNLTATGAFITGYTVILNHVSVYGLFTADTTLGGTTSTTMGMSLPIASDLMNVQDLAGTAAAPLLDGHVRIIGDTTNNRATFSWISTAAGNLTYSFHLTYGVI